MSKERKTERMQWIKGPDGKFRARSFFEIIEGYPTKYSKKQTKDKIYFKEVPLLIPLNNTYITGEKNDVLGAGSINHETLALTLYDPKTTKGLLAVLREFKETSEITVNNIVDKALEEFNLSRKEYKRLDASISGEGLIKPEKSRASKIRNALKKYKITIIGEDLKTYLGPKCVFLNCETGKVEIYHS